MHDSLVIVGGGGHAKVIADAVLKRGHFKLYGFLDDNIPVGTELFESFKCLGTIGQFAEIESSHFIVALGNNELRRKLTAKIAAVKKPAIIIHPSTIIAMNARLGAGTVVLAGAIINAGVTILENVIVNSGVVVDHDSTIEENVHLSIGTLVGSNSTVKSEKTTALGEVIPPFSTI